MSIEFKILPDDIWYYKTSQNKCSRCRRELAEDEVPLLLWRAKDPHRPDNGIKTNPYNWMLIYCERCLESVIISTDNKGENHD